MPKTIHKCEECKREFSAWKCQKRKYCSNKCRIKVLHRETPDKRRKGINKKCEYCGKEFYAPRWKFKTNRGKITLCRKCHSLE